MQAYRAKLVIDAQLNVVWTTAQELKLVPPAPPDVAHPNLEKSFPHTSKALRSLQSIGNPRNGTSQHTDVDYWRTTNGMAVCLLLLGPAFALLVLRRPRGPGGERVMFWTAAYLAFLSHLGTRVLGLFEGHFGWIRNLRANFQGRLWRAISEGSSALQRRRDRLRPRCLRVHLSHAQSISSSC